MAKDLTQIQEAETRYRRLLRKWIERTVLEADGAPCEDGRGGDLIHALWRAVQVLGSERAEAVRQEEYRIFYAKTGRCPTCGDRGPVQSDEVDHPHHQQHKRPEVVERPTAATVAPVLPALRLRPRARRGKPTTNQGD